MEQILLFITGFIIYGSMVAIGDFHYIKNNSNSNGRFKGRLKEDWEIGDKKYRQLFGEVW